MNNKIKTICLNLPEHIYNEIMQLPIANTATARLIMILEKGINYYSKAFRKKYAVKRKAAAPEQSSDQADKASKDQENNTSELTEEQQELVNIARTDSGYNN